MLATEDEEGKYVGLEKYIIISQYFSKRKGRYLQGVGSHSGFSLTREIKGTISKSVILAWRILI